MSAEPVPTIRSGGAGATSPRRDSLAGLLVVLWLAAVPAAAENDVPGGGFGIPIECALGTNCWIVNYPDAGSGPASRDFRCNHRTYDGHTGTDFAVRDLATMHRGVAVVAVAAGRVLRVRDGMSDEGAADVPDGRDCGNGVVIGHGDVWETQYCHLRKGSVAVKAGDAIRRGDHLGMVGTSGRARFPHVHLGIRRGGTPVDPFTGRPVPSGCGASGQGLWNADSRPVYAASRIVAAGFATGEVTMETVQHDASTPTALGADAPALVLWALTLGLEPGDLLRLSISGPDGGTVFSHEKVLDRTQIRRIDYGGRRARGAGWTPGVYVGEVRLLRPGLPAEGERSVRVETTLR